MDLIQTAATLALLTLLAYFIMVNVLEKMGKKAELVPSEGALSDVAQVSAQMPAPTPAPAAYISNQLDLDANRLVPIEGINTEVGVTWNTIGEQAPAGGENVTQLSVYNAEAKGVLPVNHDLFEKPANFGSDITNINQFYRNNPEIFERSLTTAPDADSWHIQSQEMFNKLANETPNSQISAYNFETDPLGGISGHSLNK